MSYKPTLSFTIALVGATLALNGVPAPAEAAGVNALQAYQNKRAIQYKRFTAVKKTRRAITFKRGPVVKRTIRPQATRRVPVNARTPNRVIHSPRYGTDYAGLRQYYSSLAGRRGIDRSPGTDPRATAYRGFQNQGRATAIRGFQNPAQSTAYRGFQNPNRATAYRGFQNQARASRFVRRR